MRASRLLKALKDDKRAIFTAAARAPMARTASPLTTTSSTPSTPQDILRNRWATCWSARLRTSQTNST